MMKRPLEPLLVLPALAGLALVGCRASDPQDTSAVGDTAASDTGDDALVEGAEEISSDVSRDTDPDVTEEQLEELVDGNTAFALDLYRYLADTEDEGFFYSPLSISMALAMTWAGARNETETEMADTLHFTLDQEDLHAAFNRLDLDLEGRNDEAWDQEIPVDLRLVNELWLQSGYDFESDFLDTLAREYGAGLMALDFAADPEAAREVINAWVETQTEGLIEDLIGRNTLNELTRFVLTNAIYFFAAWNSPFEAEDTVEETFTTTAGDEVTVPMMHGTFSAPYAEGSGWQAATMSYDGGQASMLLVLPDEGTFASFESGLDATVLGDILDDLTTHHVDFAVPRWTTSSSFRLEEALETLGMVDSFQVGSADFTGITTYEELFLSSVTHEGFVTVDEAGTEAAAATAVAGSAGSTPEHAELTLDRPFLYFVLDDPTESVLFVGRVLDPS